MSRLASKIGKACGSCWAKCGWCYYYDPPHQIYTTVNNPLFRALYPEAEGRHHFTTGLGFFAGGSTRFDAALHFSQSHLELLITSVYTF